MDRIYEAYYGTGGFGDDFMRRTRERLHWTCSQCWGKNVLDVGCSQGVGPLLLGGMGFRVEGVDVNSEAIDFAKARLAEASEEIRRNVTFRAVSFLDYTPPSGTVFDAIVMGEVLEHLVRPASFVQKAFNLMKEGGHLVITVPFGINDDPDHRQTFYLTAVYSMLFPFFEVPVVRFFGNWIGFVGKRRKEKTTEAVTIPTWLFTQAEESFKRLERPLVDTRKRMDTLSRQLSDERKKSADLQTQITTAEARLAAVETASSVTKVEVVEDEIHSLRTSLEVERKANQGQLEQIAFLKAALQLASQQKPDAANETRLLEYSAEVKELRQTLDAKRDELAARAEKFGELTARLAQAESRESATSAALAVREQKLREADLARQQTEANCAAKLREANEMAQLFEAENARLEVENKKLVEAGADAAKRLSELEQANAAAAATETESAAAISRIAAERTKLEQDLALARQHAAEQQSELAKLRASLSRETAAAQSVRQEGESSKRSLKQLSEKLRKAQEENARLQKANKSLSDAQRRAQSDARTAEETTAAQLAALREKLSSLQSELAAAQEAFASKKTECDVAVQTKTDIESKLADVQKRLDNETAWSKQHKAEVERLMAQADAATTARKTLEGNLAKAKAEASELAKRSESLQRALVAETATKSKALLEAESDRRQIDAQKAEILSLKKDIVGEIAWSKHHRQDAQVFAANKQRELANAEARFTALEKKMKRCQRQYDKLASAKLGRLTLAYWKFKDGGK